MPADTAFAHCEESNRPWDDPLERWQADSVDDEDDLHYRCPVCWVSSSPTTSR